MPEIEDVAGRPPARRNTSSAAHSTRSHGPSSAAGSRFPWIASFLSDDRPGVVEVDAPVDSDRAPAGSAISASSCGGRAGAEVDRRDARRLEHARGVRSDELAVVGDGEHADPRIEELDRVGARLRRRRDVARELLGQPLHERMPDGGLAIHERLGADKVATRLSLDEVAGDGERPAAEADERSLRFELPAHEPHGFEDRRRPLLRRRRPAAARPPSPNRQLLDHRPDARDELHLDAHAEDGRHDVGEEDGGVDAVPAHRLQRHLRAELRRPRDLEEAVLLSQRAVLGQRAPRLPHEPDRRALGRLAPQTRTRSGSTLRRRWARGPARAAAGRALPRV